MSKSAGRELVSACFHGDLKRVDKLLTMNGLDPNGTYQRHNTKVSLRDRVPAGRYSHPLLVAVSQRHSKIVQCVLDHGADPGIKDCLAIQLAIDFFTKRKLETLPDRECIKMLQILEQLLVSAKTRKAEKTAAHMSRILTKFVHQKPAWYEDKWRIPVIHFCLCSLPKLTPPPLLEMCIETTLIRQRGNLLEICIETLIRAPNKDCLERAIDIVSILLPTLPLQHDLCQDNDGVLTNIVASCVFNIVKSYSPDWDDYYYILARESQEQQAYSHTMRLLQLILERRPDVSLAASWKLLEKFVQGIPRNATQEDRKITLIGKLLAYVPFFDWDHQLDRVLNAESRVQISLPILAVATRLQQIRRAQVQHYMKTVVTALPTVLLMVLTAYMI